jgi:REP element-mobilizing transposase RayT
MRNDFCDRSVIFMPTISPLYTAQNCRVAYQLNWSLSVFWSATPPPADGWLDPLRVATESDGIRLLEHRLLETRTSQFLLSTKPETAPPAIARSVKGRLQHLLKERLQKAFRRNYSLWSVGSANQETIERYVGGQTQHHRMADRRVQSHLESLSLGNEEVDLATPRVSGHACFSYNLHLVFVNRDRGIDIRRESLEKRRSTIIAVCQKKGHLLSRGHILADHLHLALGCHLTESPLAVALGYLNNLAYVEGMKPVFDYGFYVGTFSRFDLNAVRQSLR